MDKKYELTENTKIIDNITICQIRALRDFGVVKKGDLGGYIESEINLCHKGNAWIYCNAEVFGEARVYGDAWVLDNTEVYGNARVYGDAVVCGDAEVYDKARVFGEARVYGEAIVCGEAWVYSEAIVCGEAVVRDNARVYGDVNNKGGNNG